MKSLYKRTQIVTSIIGTLIVFILLRISFEYVKGANWLLLCGYIMGVFHLALLNAAEETFNNED